MTPIYWMISNRNVTQDGLGGNQAGLSFWVSDQTTNLDQIASWTKVTQSAFRTQLLSVTSTFPPLPADGSHEDQQHLTLFVHGFNTNWQGAVQRYQEINQTLFQADQSLGLCILFSWPSKGSPTDYLPDRQEVEAAAADFADVLSYLYDYLLDIQTKTANDPSKACRAKLSLIAHSMGNYLLQKAAQTVWTRKNQPLLVSLLNQVLMVAADVDNDLFDGGEQITKSDGDALANLTYRITAFYSGLDQVLGASAGLKHFGKRRLGRSGLDRAATEPDNVWDIDCTTYFAKDSIGGINVHSAYFAEAPVLDLMRQVLRGVDRRVLTQGLQLQSSVAR